MRQFFEKHGDRAQFLFVYIYEAPHEWPEALRQFAEAPDAPLDSRDRHLSQISAGMKRFDLPFPCLIDNDQDEVATLYNAYPLRLVVVDSDGRIAIDSDFNPSQPFPWKKISDWLDRQSASLSPSYAEKRG